MRYFLILALALGSQANAQNVIQTGAPLLMKAIPPASKSKDSLFVEQASGRTHAEAHQEAVRKAYDRAFRVADQMLANCKGNPARRDPPNFGSLSMDEKQLKNGYIAKAELLMTPRAFEMLIEETISEQSVLKQSAIRSCLRPSS